MKCPSCGRDNASDRLECQTCEALLVDVFASDLVKTDPMVLPDAPTRITSEADRTPESLELMAQSRMHATGDLPRLFRFGNRYQILEKLGEGGMGRVYKALDLELDRAVALKTIRSDRTGPEVVKRFKQELVLARKITHKNVVRIYDLGEVEGMKFFTMELIEGKSLSELLAEKKRLTPKEAIGYMKQILSGLAEAHSQGVVHRDLKPQNIMLDEHDRLRIMDFGIARTADTATLTGTSEMIGTPDYISPEQVKGENAGPQSDLYSLGVILYELLTGKPPFKGDTAISKVVSRIQTKPEPPRTLNKDIPPYFERIILKLMEVDLELRYQSASEVLQDLEREQVDRSPLLRARKALARHRGWVAAALILAVTGGLAYYANRISTSTSEASQSEPTVTIAVLPFRSVTRAAELDWMESGIPEILVTDIAQSRVLRPVLSERVSSILDDLGKSDVARFDEETVKLVAEKAGADETLYGNFVKAEGRLRFDLTLRSSTTGVRRPIVVEGKPSEVFSLVDELTSKLAEVLKVYSGRDDRPVAEVSTSSLQAFQTYREGLRELHNGKIKSAIPHFKGALELDDSFVMAQARLAEAYFHAGMEADAKEAIARAQELASGAALPIFETYLIHAIAARIHDDPETAVTSYKKLVELYPSDPDIGFGLASSLETNGRVGESIEAYRAVLGMDPDYGAALLGLGRTLVVADRPDEAIPIIREAMDSRYFEGNLETLGMMHSILGVAFKDTGDYAQASVEFEKSLEYRMEAEDARGIVTSLTNLASALRRVGRTTEASERLNEALERARAMKNKTVESFTLQNLGNLELGAGRLDDALEHYRQSLNIELERNEHTELAARLDAIAQVLIHRGLLADAAIFLERSSYHLDQSDDSTERAFNMTLRGQLSSQKGNLDAASSAFLEALALYQQLDSKPDIAAIMVALSGVYVQQGRLDEAVSTLDTAMERAPSEHRRIALGRAELCLAIGHREGAIRALESERLPDAAVEEPLEGLNRELLIIVAGEEGTLSSERLASVVERARSLGVVDVRLSAELELGAARLAEGEAQAAIELARRVQAEAKQRWLKLAEARSELLLARAHELTGNREAAIEHATASAGIAQTVGARLIALEAYRLMGRIEPSGAYLREADSLLERLLRSSPAELVPFLKAPVQKKRAAEEAALD